MFDERCSLRFSWCNSAVLNGVGHVQWNTFADKSGTSSNGLANASQREASTIVETSPVKSSGSLGGAERYIESILAEIRALRATVELTWNVKVTVNVPIFPWMPPHASWLLSRFQPWHGKTPYEAVRGKIFAGGTCPFSSPVLVKLPDVANLSKLDDRWTPEIRLGETGESDKHIVGTRLEW